MISTGIVSAAQPYWIDPHHNLWLNISMNGSPQYFNVYNETGYTPNGDAVMWTYDNFSSPCLDTNRWTVYKGGENEAMISLQNGQMVLEGAGVISSANVILNKQFKAGIELAVNETLTKGTFDAGTYSDTSFGFGIPVGESSRTSWRYTLLSFLDLDNLVGIDIGSEMGWWHTLFSENGGAFQSQGISRSMIWVDSSTSDAIMPNPGITLSDYTGENISHTVAYGYDASGNAYMNMLNVNQSQLPLSIPDPYAYNQFIHPDVYYNASGVFGHKWWMLITPYAYSNITYENACLYHSDDGLLWYAPPGVTNPIEKPIEAVYNRSAYGSDSDLVYSPATGKLMCYYVIGDIIGNLTIEDPKLRIYDGNNVSSEMNISVHGVSPAVLYDNSTGTFYMWIIDIDSKPNVIYRYTSTDGANFFNKQAVDQSSNHEIWHMNVINCPGNSKLYALFTFVGNDNLYLATANNYTDNFTVQSFPLLKVEESSSTKHKNIQLYRSAGAFSNEGKLLKLWIPAKDENGVWTVFYTQATSIDDVWKVGKFTTWCAPIMTVQNTQYLNTPKQWMFSQGDYTNNKGVKRKINEVWGYKTGHTPEINVKNMGECIQIEVAPTDSQNVPDYQVMIPSSMLGISSQEDSLDIESFEYNKKQLS